MRPFFNRSTYVLLDITCYAYQDVWPNICISGICEKPNTYQAGYLDPVIGQNIHIPSAYTIHGFYENTVF